MIRGVKVWTAEVGSVPKDMLWLVLTMAISLVCAGEQYLEIARSIPLPGILKAMVCNESHISGIDSPFVSFLVRGRERCHQVGENMFLYSDAWRLLLLLN